MKKLTYKLIIVSLLSTLKLHCTEDQKPTPEAPTTIEVADPTSEFERTWLVFITAGLFAVGLLATKHPKGNEVTS